MPTSRSPSTTSTEPHRARAFPRAACGERRLGPRRAAGTSASPRRPTSPLPRARPVARRGRRATEPEPTRRRAARPPAARPPAARGRRRAPRPSAMRETARVADRRSSSAATRSARRWPSRARSPPERSRRRYCGSAPVRSSPRSTGRKGCGTSDAPASTAIASAAATACWAAIPPCLTGKLVMSPAANTASAPADAAVLVDVDEPLERLGNAVDPLPAQSRERDDAIHRERLAGEEAGDCRRRARRRRRRRRTPRRPRRAARGRRRSRSRRTAGAARAPA